MKLGNLLIGLIFIFSITFSAQGREFVLDGNEVFIGPLAQEVGDPAFESIKVYRTEYTDRILKITYMYDIEETWCEDRRGNGHHHLAGQSKTNRTIRTSPRTNSGRTGRRGRRGYGYGHGNPHGPYIGTCRSWTQKPTTKTKVLTLDFSAVAGLGAGEEQKFTISFLQKDAYSITMRTNINQGRNEMRYRISRVGNIFYFR